MTQHTCLVDGIDNLSYNWITIQAGKLYCVIYGTDNPHSNLKTFIIRKSFLKPHIEQFTQ